MKIGRGPAVYNWGIGGGGGLGYGGDGFGGSGDGIGSGPGGMGSGSGSGFGFGVDFWRLFMVSPHTSIQENSVMSPYGTRRIMLLVSMFLE
jgi:hypothetical protein